MKLNKGDRVSCSVNKGRTIYGTVQNSGEYLVDVLFDEADFVDLNIQVNQLNLNADQNSD